MYFKKIFLCSNVSSLNIGINYNEYLLKKKSIYNEVYEIESIKIKGYIGPHNNLIA